MTLSAGSTYSVMKGCGPVLDAVYEAHVTPAVMTGAVGALHWAAWAYAEAVMLGRPLTQVMRRRLFFIMHGLRITETNILFLFICVNFQEYPVANATCNNKYKLSDKIICNGRCWDDILTKTNLESLVLFISPWFLIDSNQLTSSLDSERVAMNFILDITQSTEHSFTPVVP